MKKTLILVLLVSFSFTLSAQEQFKVNIKRVTNKTGSPLSSFMPLSVSYMGNQKGIIRNKESFSFQETMPGDSIIELSFRKGGNFPTKFFLYPNGTFEYNLETKVGLFGLNIKDKSIYPGIGVSDAEVNKAGSINKKNLGVSYTYERTLKSEDIRKQWLRQGGKLTGRSLLYVLTFAGMKMEEPGVSTTTTTIVGGGWTYTENRYNIKIPEYKPGIATWNSLVYGYGLSLNLHMSQVKVDLEDNTFVDDMEMTSGSFLFMLTPNVGYTLGLGKFKTEKEYKGVALDLTYRPSLILTLSEGGNMTQFNYMGFGFDLSRTSFAAFANRIAPRAKSKFTFFMLPPLGDTPLMVTFGYGLVWYR